MRGGGKQMDRAVLESKFAGNLDRIGGEEGDFSGRVKVVLGGGFNTQGTAGDDGSDHCLQNKRRYHPLAAEPARVCRKVNTCRVERRSPPCNSWNTTLARRRR